MSDEIWRKSASGLAAAIRSGELSSREVVEAHLARIDAVNDRLNAVTVVLAESARAAADAADQGEARGPLHGVPFTVKENIDCVGSATTQGLPALAGAMPAVDAPAFLWGVGWREPRALSHVSRKPATPGNATAPRTELPHAASRRPVR